MRPSSGATQFLEFQKIIIIAMTPRLASIAKLIARYDICIRQNTCELQVDSRTNDLCVYTT